MFQYTLPRLIALLCFCQICIAQISPVPVAEWPEVRGGPPNGLTFDGDRLYVTTPFGVVVVDVSDPSNMRAITILDRTDSEGVTSLVPGKLILQERYLRSLRVRNVQDVLEPFDIEMVSGPGPGYWPAVSWPYVYTSGTNIVIWDFTDPAHPVPVRSVATNSAGLFIHGNVLAARRGNNEHQFDFFDITDRTIPKFIGNPSQSNTWKITFDRNFVYVAGYTVQVIDLSGMTLKTVATWPYSGNGVIAAHNGIFAQCQNADVRIIDATNPTQPIDIATIHTLGTAPPALAFHNDKFFCADTSGITCYDMTDPHNPTPIGSLHFSPTASKLKKVENRLFVQQEGQPIQALDLTNPGNPIALQTRLPVAVAMDVVGSKLFLINSNRNNFHIYDASDLVHPRLLASLPLQSLSTSLAVAGTLAFIDESNTVRVFDVSAPSTPTLRTNIGGAPFRWIEAIKHVGNLVYAFGTLQTNIGFPTLLKIIDAETAELLSEVTTPDTYFLNAAGSAAYVGLFMYDCSDPRHPLLKGKLPLDPYLPPLDIVLVTGPTNRLFASTYYDLVELDMSDPFAPKVLSRNLGYYDGLLPNGDFLYAVRRGAVVTFQIFGEAPATASLNVSQFGDMHRVKWPKRFDGYKLLTAPTPTGPWAVNSRPVLNSDYTYDFEVFVPNRNSSEFYKLEK